LLFLFLFLFLILFFFTNCELGQSRERQGKLAKN